MLRWCYQGHDGTEVAGPQITFEDQTAAEEWLSAAWPDLLNGGVEAVTLVDGTDRLYGPMSLRGPD